MASRPWYKHYPSNFLNGCMAADMNAEQIGVYIVVLDLIYDRGGPIPNKPKTIGAMCGLSTTRCRRIIADLCAMPNKLTVDSDGKLANNRAKIELKSGEKERENQAKNGRKGAEKRWNQQGELLENQDVDEKSANGKHDGHHDGHHDGPVHGIPDTRYQKIESLPTHQPPSSTAEAGAGGGGGGGGEADVFLVEAKAILATLRDTLSTGYALPGWNHHRDDLILARSLARSGFGAVRVRPVIERLVASRIANGEPPPTSLAYFERAIRAEAAPAPDADPRTSPEYWAKRLAATGETQP